MPYYYVNDNAQTNGDHEVHESGCSWLNMVYSKTPLGYHDNCYSAVREAKMKYYQSNGCAYCCPACHTS
jgi:hypothetical protein